MKYLINKYKQKLNIDYLKYLFKLLLIAISIPVGLSFSIYLAYYYINFRELIETINDNLTNIELLTYIARSFKVWYIVSFSLLILSIIVSLSFSFIKPSDKENISLFSAIGISIVIFLIIQIVLPLCLLLFGMCIILLYLIFVSSMITKNIISYPFYLFVVILEKFCTSTGLSISYGDFIGQQRYSTFLTLITFFVSAPYLLNLSILLIKKGLIKINGSNLISLFFKPIDYVFRINNIRYFTYIFLFFTSILTYSMNISTNDVILMMAKESLLEFVLLDTITYSIYNNIYNVRKRRKLRIFLQYIRPYRYDLEFVSNIIVIYNLKNIISKARISFQVNNNIKKKLKLSEFDDLNKVLTELSSIYMEINVLEKNIREALILINIIETKLQSC
ncbi:hypothetical protein [Clostridium sp. WB02_MRS01]|uniref:hypothetical protein n=1 Tax=Clostridium sp. WB02_MRS01 TaxID=2605777 RepID=UPI001A9C0899|nr:hypothetical protein [Clostridium sp. WB02_MRS01]